MKKLLLSFILIFTIQFSFAQQPCGTYEYENYLNQQYPGFSDALYQTRHQSINAINSLNKAGETDSVLRIPVVFHIVWNTAEQNIDDSLIYSQIKALNEAYRHTHKDTGNIRDIFKPVAGDTKIEFYLADKDPMGNPTNGIDRFYTSRTDFNDNSSLFGEAVKYKSKSGVDAWNASKYLNIWVCKFTYFGQLAVVAYAYPPINAKNWSSVYYKSLDAQGVVINYQFVGVQNPLDQLASSLKERTLVHEVGHFLGLRHIWGDKNNCLGEDDGVKDTPNASSSTQACSTSKNTCFETNDMPDMTENYMDYTPYPCTMMFTKEQIELMRFNLINLRPNIYNIKKDVIPTPPASTISVSPNPVKGEIKMLFAEKGSYQLVLIDIIGQAVVREDINVTDNKTYTLSGTTLSSGIYYLSLSQNNDLVYKQKIVVD